MKSQTRKLLIVSLAPTILKNDRFYSYAPYVDEMDIWFKYSKDKRILAPFHHPSKLLLKAFSTSDIKRYYIPYIAFNTYSNVLISLIKLPFVLLQMFRAMFWADHIHLRCPGNIGLLGCLVQVFFPSRQKTAKYAGNWDPKAKQPLSYKFQKWILSNTFLTKNMQVLVYGQWGNQTKNIKPFFTATYSEAEKVSFSAIDYTKPLQFVFAGMLVPGKRPLLAIQFVEELNKRGIPANLELFGDGPLRQELDEYVADKKIKHQISLHGNQDKSAVKAALIKSHFNILLSKSEGWPKALAEGMFFGCIPVTTTVSCVPWMLDEGQRGIIVKPELEAAVSHFIDVYKPANLDAMAQKALHWSQRYTLDRFELEIKKLLCHAEGGTTEASQFS
ncbi:glycosyltransferase family 4 protein [Tamlana sp. I1]|uniref:glycosyltransferase family 4 protein n=1 Tax=Tamlana sp. I1 TaxID=2762061 RepID=UPI00188E3845|nr:glycosyltransferase family 4 protein [Tamlana sp. I1]